MSKCQRCESDRIFVVGGKSSDLNDYSFKDKEAQGYLPSVQDICGGDYFGFSVCLECGQIQGQFPKNDPQIGDEEEEDYEDE